MIYIVPILFLNFLIWAKKFPTQKIEEKGSKRPLTLALVELGGYHGDFRIEYRLMIALPTQKHHKSPFTHSKTIYVFTSGRIIVTVQIHSRRKAIKGA
jgi:hypothetical protein